MCAALYGIKSVKKIRFSKQKRHFEFQAHWAPSDEDANPEPSWEPIECLTSVPKLLLEFEKSCHKKWQAELAKGGQGPGQGSLWKKPMNPEDGQCIPTVLAGLDYRMEGHEQVRKIHAQYKSTSLFVVRFRTDGHGYKFVHRAFLEYYCPTRFALYLLKKEKKHNEKA